MKDFAIINASVGTRLNCRQTPIITALGALKTILKSLGVIVNPIPNITIPSKRVSTYPTSTCLWKKNPITAATDIDTKKLFVANILNF